MTEESTMPQKDSRRVAFVLQRGDELAHGLASVVEEGLRSVGYGVTLSRALNETTLESAGAAGLALREADVALAFVSAQAAHDEAFDHDVETALEAARAQVGRPMVWIIRVRYTGDVLENVAAAESAREAFGWDGPDATDALVRELVGALDAFFEHGGSGLKVPVPKKKAQRPPAVAQQRPLPADEGRSSVELEPVGGAAPLGSRFYVERDTDGELRRAVAKNDSIILVKGPRQIGKTSLLARGLQHARESNAVVALTDFQKFNAVNLNDIVSFFVSMGESLADQLDLDVYPSDVWNERRGPSVNFERYMRKYVLSASGARLVWGLDEVDRLFGCSYGSEVFGLFRSWHNERALDPSGPWERLTLCIAYATEAHLFISDLNQSPFNVGTRLELKDFDRAAIVDLNQRHGAPLASDAHIERFRALVGGHPFLVRKGLSEMVSKGLGIGDFEVDAPSNDGVFGDHLRRILILLGRDPQLLKALRSILREGRCENPDEFFRLRAAGLVLGTMHTDVRLRCHLYDTYLSERLL